MSAARFKLFCKFSIIDRKRSVHQVSVHVMAAQSSNQLFYGVSASVAPDGSLVIDESAADRVQTQPVPMLLEDFLSDESSSEEGQAKSPTKIEKWKNKMISALTDALQKLEVDEKKNQIPRELNPVVDMVKDLLAKMTDGKAVERIKRIACWKAHECRWNSTI